MRRFISYECFIVTQFFLFWSKKFAQNMSQIVKSSFVKVTEPQLYTRMNYHYCFGNIMYTHESTCCMTSGFLVDTLDGEKPPPHISATPYAFICIKGKPKYWLFFKILIHSERFSIALNAILISISGSLK